jgi:endonuclease/exonuclease/phosphatase family metal-dependent hydrolase
MADIYKFATLNINKMSSRMRMRMLEEFLQKQEIDILLLQEVTHTEFDMIRGYKAHTNIGINNRGTAMLTRETKTLTNITRLPSGRGMADCYRGVLITNINAPSGSSRRQERENFYNVELTYLLRSIPPTMIIGGDFNSVPSQTDCTGNINYRKALDRMVRGLDLTYVWETTPPELYTRIIPTRRGTLALSLLDDTTFKGQVQQDWLQRRQQERKYLDTVTWWVNYVKRKIRYMFINEGKERVRTERMNENFYYTCIYDVL